MNTRINYEQLAAKLDYGALEKKLTQLSQVVPPKRRKTVADLLEPVQEKLVALHQSGWTSVQLVAELKAAGVPVSPARLRECLNRWISGGNRTGKRRNRRPQAELQSTARASITTTTPASVKKTVPSTPQGTFTLR